MREGPERSGPSRAFAVSQLTFLMAGFDPLALFAFLAFFASAGLASFGAFFASGSFFA